MRRVISRARKDFGFIVKGTENDYNPQLDYIEHKIYEVYKEIPISDHSLQKVIEIFIYDLKGIIENKTYDYNDIATSDEIKFSKELEMLFNPFLNEKIIINDSAKENIKDLFIFPIKCLLRIHDSIDFWHNVYGINGYYKMLEEMVLPIRQIGKYPYALEEKYLD